MIVTESQPLLERHPAPASSTRKSLKPGAACEVTSPVVHEESHAARDARSKRLAILLAQSADKNQDAFRELYKLTASRLFGVALRVLRRRAPAEDVLQESYLNIWHRAASYRPDKGEPLAWMTAIVRNRCVDWLRQSKQEQAAEISTVPIDERADENPGPLEQAALSDQSRALNRCLGGLEPAQRQSIALAFLYGLSHAEVATHLQQPVGTVKSWIRRGLQRMSRCDGIAVSARSRDFPMLAK